MLPADRVELTILVENWIDMLLSDQSRPAEVSRFGLIEHFDPNLTPPLAENGISILLRVRAGNYENRIIFDVGLTGRVLIHNLAALNIDPNSIDHIVISHGHPDHYGGIHSLLESMDREVPISTHPDAFLPRYALMGDGRVSPYYNHTLIPDELGKRGGRVVAARSPLELGLGVSTTGEIPRVVEFEGPIPPETRRSPGLWQISPEGEWRLDEVWDEQGLVVEVKNEGLVVLTGCAHAGVVNTVKRAQQLTGNETVLAVIGGFHLGFPTTPLENVHATVEALKDMDVQTIVPMHCSGLRAHAAFSASLSDRYVQPAVGTTLVFGR